MTRWEVYVETEKLLEVSSELTDLSFTQTRRGKVHMDLSFLNGAHGDGAQPKGGRVLLVSIK